MMRTASSLALALACFAQTSSDGVLRLHPREFPELPGALAAALESRGCTIPQVPMIGKRHNVIRGEFAKPGQTDWAVLCSVKGSSSVVVFWNGSPSNPAVIEERPDSLVLQSWTGGKMVYSRDLSAVGEEFIMSHYRGNGGPTPPPIDHQGVNDDFFGKASVVLYYYHGKWLHLAGAD
jgi:hypothetical protein